MAYREFARELIVLFVLLCIPMGNALANSDPCYGLTYEGHCDGEIAQWFENGEIIQVDCSDQGMMCAWNEEKSYYGCSSASNTDEVCAIPQGGTCHSESIVAWCHDNGETATLECGEGTICGWNEEESYYDCVPEEETPRVSMSENITEEGGDDEDNTMHPSQDHKEDPVVQAETVSEGTAEVFDFENEDPGKTDTPEPFMSPTSAETASPGCRSGEGAMPVSLSLLLLGGIMMSLRRSSFSE